MAVDVGSAVGYLDLDISGFLRGLQDAESEANKSTLSLADKIGNNISGIGTKLSGVGTTLTKTVTMPLVGIGAAGLKTAVDFEKGMSEVKAISGASGKELEALREKAIELGADTAFSAGEVAAAMTEMAKAGWNSQQIIDGMGGVLDAAAASGEGLASVSTIVADAITGFGLEAKDSTKVADLLTQAANSGTIGITDLGESFKYIAPVASSMGLNITDVTTALSAMSMAGIKGSQAGTALRTLLTRMVKPTDAVAEAMETLGVSIINDDGSMKSLNDIVSTLRDSFDGLSDSEKAKYAATLAGQEGMAGMLSLLNLTEEEYDAISKSMEESSGVASETASIMQDNLGSKLEQLMGSLESLAIKLSEFVIPKLKELVDWITSLVDKFTSLDEGTQKTILKFAAFAAAAGPVLVIVGKLTSAVGTFVKVVGNIGSTAKAVKTSCVAMVNGCKNVHEGFVLAKAGYSGLATASGSTGSAIGAAMAGISGSTVVACAGVVAAIALVVAAFVSLWKTNDEFREKITSAWNQIKEAFNRLTSGIVEKINKLGFDFENIGEVIRAVWDGLCSFFAPTFEYAFQMVADFFDFFVDSILNTLDFWISIFTGDWEGAWNALKSQFENIWNTIKDFFENICDHFTGVLDAFCGLFGTTWEEVWSSIKDFFVNIWTGISDFFKGLWDGITSFCSKAWDTIKSVIQVAIMFIVELLTAAFNLITLPFRFIWENCKEYIIAAWEAIKSAVSTALNAIKNVISNIWNSIKAFLEPLLNALSNTFSNIWNGIKNVVSNVVNSVKTTVSNAFNAVKETVSSIFNGIKTTASDVWNKIKSAVTTPVNSIKNTVSSTFDSVKTKVSSVFDNIKSSISSKIQSARDTVKGAIDKIKGFFNFSWSLPKLKMPHPKISGSFSLNPPSVPKFSIEWYKKAMGNGMILNSPTIFGYDSKSGQFLGAGEAGSETIVGTESLMRMIEQAATTAINRAMSAMMQTFSAINQDVKTCTMNLLVVLKEILFAYRDLGRDIDDLRDERSGRDDNDILIQRLIDVLRSMPLSPNIQVIMEDGDVVLDGERVGRTIAPTVSRVIVQGTK